MTRRGPPRCAPPCKYDPSALSAVSCEQYRLDAIRSRHANIRRKRQAADGAHIVKRDAERKAANCGEPINATFEKRGAAPRNIMLKLEPRTQLGFAIARLGKQSLPDSNELHWHPLVQISPQQHRRGSVMKEDITILGGLATLFLWTYVVLPLAFYHT